MVMMILKIGGGVVLGGGVGFLLHYISKCSGASTWGITANPYIAVIIGAVMGALLIGGIGK